MFNLSSDPKEFSQVLALVIFAALVALGLLISKKQNRKKIFALRRQLRQQQLQNSSTAAGASPSAQSIVRASDLIRLTREDETKRQTALREIETGSVREGARKLEELGLHRQAISALEQHHMIDDACGVLIRMNRPNRAAVVYQRNNIYIKAAECFLIANMPEEAARCYMDAGKTNSAEYLHASDLYESLEKIPEALEALKYGGFTENLVQVALRHGSFHWLRDFMSTEQNTRNVFAYLDVFSSKKLIKTLPLDTQTVEHFAIWCQTLHRHEVLENCVKRIYPQLPLLTLFWKLVSEEYALQNSKIVTIGAATPAEQAAFHKQNAKALFHAEKYACALHEFTKLDAGIEQAQCHIALGNLEATLQLMAVHHELIAMEAEFKSELYSLHKKEVPLEEVNHETRAALIRYLDQKLVDDQPQLSQAPLSLTA